MKRVTGIGGVFFKSNDPQKIREWYSRHLGIQANEYGAVFDWKQKNDPTQFGHTVWNPFPANTKYFDPGKKDFMFNYRVDNLEELIKTLKAEGVEVVGEIEGYEYGKFGWIMDPEGNKIELWEPNDEEFRKMGESAG